MRLKHDHGHLSGLLKNDTKVNENNSKRIILKIKPIQEISLEKSFFIFKSKITKKKSQDTCLLQKTIMNSFHRPAVVLFPVPLA